jgi:hypothetical protein
LRRPVFRSLWIGSVVANLATWMRDVAGAWLKGVRVNALAPGWFPSEMTAETFGDERSLRWIRGKTPMGRAGREHELDGALLFLASDASTYVTGQTIVVDGGWVVA